jgi:hypothetical protein
MPAVATRIALRCSACGKTYSLKPELAGKTAQCTCGTRLKIPAAPASSTAPHCAPSPSQPAPPSPLEEKIFDAEPFDAPDFLGADVFEAEPLAANVFDAALPDDDGLELEAPVEREVPTSVRRAITQGKLAPIAPPRRSIDPISEWPLRFVGVYGFVIMGAAALIGVSNVLLTLMLCLRTDVTLSASAGLAVMCLIQSLIWFFVFRLGRGLVDCERSAVQGLLVIYLLIVAPFAYVAWQWPDRLVPVLIGAGVISLVILPPIIVAFLNWSDFRGSDE